MIGRVSRRAGGLAALAILLPAAASAHSLSGRVETPIPFPAFLIGAALAVAASFLLVIVGNPRGPQERPPAPVRRVPRPVRLALRALGLVAWAWIVAQTLIGGSSDAEVSSLFLWTYGWVGLAIVSALIGPAWSWLDPFATLHDLGAALLRRLGVRGLAAAPWPARLGTWAAVAGFLVFVWIELVPRLAGGRLLGVVLIAYTAVVLLGMAQYGRDAWRSRAEVFSVWFGVLGRMARYAPAGDPESGLVRRQGMVEGLVAAPWTTSLVVLVTVGMGSVIYDGISQTQVYRDVVGLTDPLIGTLSLAVVLGVLVLAVLGTARLTGLAAMGAGLVPVALGYLVAHYLTALLMDGQRIVIAISDPFQLGWDLFGTAFHEASLDAIPTGIFWTLQVGAVVAGHAAGAWAGHVAARREHPGEERRSAQVALALLMVALTTLTLWSLGQNLVFEDGTVAALGIGAL